MRLVSFISLRLSVVAAVVLALWSVAFYAAMMAEINDEVDDSLEDLAEVVIRRSLAGEPLPSEPTGSNNQYYLREVTAAYADTMPRIRYEDRMVYIKEKGETEPARALSYIYITDDGRHMEVEVSVPTIDKSDLKEAIFYSILFLYVAILIVIILLNIYTLHYSMRPLKRLLSRIDRYRPGSKRKRGTTGSTITEFVRLDRAVENLMERSEAAYRQQQLFIGHASHEMQTPLAVCQSRLEMLLDDEGLSEQQMGEIVKTLGTIDSMSRLNRTLLLLCKIDNGQFHDVGDVDLSLLAATIADDVALVYEHKGLTLTVRAQQPMHATMSRQLGSVLLTNLIKNAFVHCPAGGQVTIVSTSTTLAVSNTGEGPLDTDLVFRPFYHSGSSKTSTGLGLTIVQAVCDNCGLAVGYSFSDGRHVFTLSVR